MLNRVFATLALLVASAAAWPQGSEKVSALPSMTTFGGSEIFFGLQFGADAAANPGQFYNYFIGLGIPATAITSGALPTGVTLPTSQLTGALAAAQEPAHTGDMTNSAGSLATSVVKVNGNTPGGSCTNQAVTSVSSSAVPACSTLSSAYVDTSIAKTGADINTSNQVTVTHLASPEPVAQGGTGAPTLTGIVTGSGTSALGTSTLPGLNISGGPGSTNSYLYSTAAITGTGTPTFDSKNRASILYWNISDTTPWTNNGVGATGIADNLLFYTTLATGWDGFRGGFETDFIVNAPPATLSSGGNQISTNIIPLRSQVNINSNMGGIVGSHLGGSGVIDGANINIFSGVSAPFPFYLGLLQGAEFDINTRPGEVISDRYGLSFNLGAATSTTAADEQGQYSDVMVKAGTGDNFGSSAWACLLCDGSFSGAAPTNYNSIEIGAYRRFLGSFAQPQLYFGSDYRETSFANGLSATYTITAVSQLSTSLAQVTLTPTPTGEVIGANIVVAGITGTGCTGYNTGTSAAFVTQVNSTNLITYANRATGTSCTLTGATATIFTLPGGPIASSGAEIDYAGNVYGQSIVVGPSGLSSQTGTVASVSVYPRAGYIGGAYFGSASDPTITIDPPTTGGSAATATITTRFLNAALLMDSNGNSTSGSGAGCTLNDTLTVSGGTASTAATVTVTSVSGGTVTGLAIANAGAYSVLPATTPGTVGTTGGTCSTQPNVSLGFGIALSVSGGSGYPCAPAPLIYSTAAHGYSNQINTPIKAAVKMTCATIPLAVSAGVAGTTSVSAATAGTVGERYSLDCAALTGVALDATTPITLTSPAVFKWSGAAAPWTLTQNTAAFLTNWTCPVNFTTTGALPTFSAVQGWYFVIGSTWNAVAGTFQVADTAAHAIAGTNAVNASGSQSGTQTGVMGVTGAFGTVSGNTYTGAGMQLTAGDWECNGLGAYLPTGATGTGYFSSVAGTSTSLGGAGTYASNRFNSAAMGTIVSYWPAYVNEVLSAGTPSVFETVQANLTVGSMQESGSVTCKRIR